MFIILSFFKINLQELFAGYTFGSNPSWSEMEFSVDKMVSRYGVSSCTAKLGDVQDFLNIFFYEG